MRRAPSRLRVVYKPAIVLAWATAIVINLRENLPSIIPSIIGRR